MVKKLYNETFIEDIAHAIREKNGSEYTYTVQEMGDAIREIPSGGGASGEKVVELIDYDGTVLYEYTKEEFLALNDYPDHPNHEGLTNMGWNWDLENAKTFIEDRPYLCIGATYQTDNGETRVYITIQNESMLQIYTGINMQQSTVEIDWGDGSETTQLSNQAGTKYTGHKYAQTGDYVIRIRKIAGTGTYSFAARTTNTTLSYALIGTDDTSKYSKNINNAYLSMITKIELGIHYAYSVAYNLCTLINMKTIMISVPENPIALMQANAFAYNTGLSAIVFPKNIPIIGNYALRNSSNISKISMSDEVTSIGDYTFAYIYRLRKIAIPDSLTTIKTYAFGYDYCLEEVIIPETTTTVGDYLFNYSGVQHVKTPILSRYMFNNCKNLNYVETTSTATSLPNSCFASAFVDKVELPNVTSLNSNVFNASSIKEIIMPKCYQIGSYLSNVKDLQRLVLDYDNLQLADSCFNKVFGITGEFVVAPNNTIIYSSSFQDCDFNTITILGDITRVWGTYAFYSLSITQVNFVNNTAVPTLDNTLAFNPSATNLYIIVPKNLYNDWIVAENWSSLASKIYYIDDNGDLSQEVVA